MGHEIANALANHGAKRMSQQQLVQFGGILGRIELGNGQWGGLFHRMYSTVAGLTILSYSRSQESEADEIGL